MYMQITSLDFCQYVHMLCKPPCHLADRYLVLDSWEERGEKYILSSWQVELPELSSASIKP